MGNIEKIEDIILLGGLLFAGLKVYSIFKPSSIFGGFSNSQIPKSWENSVDFSHLPVSIGKGIPMSDETKSLRLPKKNSVDFSHLPVSIGNGMPISNENTRTKRQSRGRTKRQSREKNSVDFSHLPVSIGKGIPMSDETKSLRLPKNTTIGKPLTFKMPTFQDYQNYTNI